MERMRHRLMQVHPNDDHTQSPVPSDNHPKSAVDIPPFSPSTPPTRRASAPSLRRLSTTSNAVTDELRTSRIVPAPPLSPKLNEITSLPRRITSRNWDIFQMCHKYPRFQHVRRVSALATPDELSRALDEYERTGEPMIIEDWHKHPKWRPDILNLEWLLANQGNKEINVRNVHDSRDTPTTFSEFIATSRAQDVYNSPEESQRLYWKDADCPEEWRDWLKQALPRDILPGCPDDLLRHLYSSETVESLLCYLGIGDTFTAAHKDLCASSGHNLMCFSENDGSSFWFMTESGDASMAAQYFHDELKQELDWETHITTLHELGSAPFKVYVAQQKVGDLVLVPPQSVHQVVNHGGLAMKASWSRMTLKNLQVALHTELPIYHRVCRSEQYRVKTILYRSVLYHTEQLQLALRSVPESEVTEVKNGLQDALGDYASTRASESPAPSRLPDPARRIAETLSLLLELFDNVLCEEYATNHERYEHIVRHSSYSSVDDTLLLASPSRHARSPCEAHERRDKEQPDMCNFACDFCGADIFQSFFECRYCREPEGGVEPRLGDGVLLCPACYVEGRTCGCGNMQPAQCRPFKVLLEDRNRATQVCNQVIPPAVLSKGSGRRRTTEILTESDLKDVGHLLVFEGACILHQFRLDYRNKCGQFARCRSGREHHEVNWLATAMCGKCRNRICYEHLLARGTHSADAILNEYAQKHGDEDAFHHMHSINKGKQPLKPYHVRGGTKRRMVASALSFPDCKPGMSGLMLGWYDTGNTYMNRPFSSHPTVLPPIRTQNLSNPTSHATEPDHGGMSPLTPIEASDSSPDKGRHPANSKSLSPSPTCALALVDGPCRSKAMRNQIFVQIPPLRKRSASSASLQVGPPSKKPRRSATLGEPKQKRQILGRMGGLESAKPSRSVAARAVAAKDPSMPDDALSEDYASNLAAAMTRAQTSAPVFTQVIQERPHTLRRAQRRVIDSDYEDEDYCPPRSAATTVPPSNRDTTIHNSQHPRSVSILPLPRRALPRTLPSSTGSPVAAQSASASPQKSSRIPKTKRKTKGPPGLTPEQLSIFTANKARTTSEDVVEVILVDPDDAVLLETFVQAVDTPPPPTAPVPPPPMLPAPFLPPPPPREPVTLPLIPQQSSNPAAPALTPRIPDASPHLQGQDASGTDGQVPMDQDPSPTGALIRHSENHPPAPGPSRLPLAPTLDKKPPLVEALEKAQQCFADLAGYVNVYEQSRHEQPGLAELTARMSVFEERNKHLEAEGLSYRIKLAEQNARIEALLEQSKERQSKFEKLTSEMKALLKNERTEQLLSRLAEQDARIEALCKQSEERQSKLEEQLKTERTERHHMTTAYRALEEDIKTGKLWNSLVKEQVQDILSSEMPKIRESVLAMAMAGKPTQSPILPVSPIERRDPEGCVYGPPHPPHPPHPPAPHAPHAPAFDQYRPRPEDGRQYRPDGQHGFNGHGVGPPGNNYMRGPSRGGPHFFNNNRRDFRRDNFNPAGRGRPYNNNGGGNYAHPPHHQNNNNNNPGWTGNRHHSPEDRHLQHNDRRMRSKSPSRTRTPDRDREPSPRPNLRQAMWDQNEDLGSRRRYGEDESMGATRSGTDMSLSPIEHTSSSSSSEGSRATHSEIQESSFTEKESCEKPSSIHSYDSKSPSQYVMDVDTRQS